MEFLQAAFKIILVLYTISNLAGMGLELNLKESLKSLRSLKVIAQIVLWGWIVGPALMLTITTIIPSEEGHKAGMLLICLAPTAPLLPLMIRKAKGDMSFAGAFMALTTLGTVIFLPLLAPFMIKGIQVDTASLIKPLLTMVLIPLIIGIIINAKKEKLAQKLLIVCKKTGSLTLVIALVMVMVLYGKDMLGTIGSFSPGSQLLFFVLMAIIPYVVPLGLKVSQRSTMSIGMSTRNSAVLMAAMGISETYRSDIVIMIILAVPMTVAIALISARIFAKHADA